MTKSDKKIESIVRESLAKGYEFEWEDMAEEMTEALGVAVERRKEASKYVARVLRGQYRMRRAAWEDKEWSDVEVLHIMEVAKFEIAFTVEKRPAPKVDEEKNPQRVPDPTPEEIEARKAELKAAK